MAEQFVFPMSAAQAQLWFLGELHPGDFSYNIAGAVRLSGALDRAALESSIAGVVSRHESLRTTFELVGEQPSQVITTGMDIRVSFRDLATLSAAERHAERVRLMREEAQAPFDLRRGPLLRCTLVRLADGEHVLLVTMHHIIADGWSLAVFTRELCALYDAFVHHRPPALPVLPIQYADYVCWQQGRLQQEELAAQLEYWRRQLDGAPALITLPTDRSRPAEPIFAGASVIFELDRGLIADLEAVGRECGSATLFMVLLAAFGVLLHRYSGDETIVIGSPVSGRQQPDTEELIGLFVNTLPIRIDCGPQPSFLALIAQVRDTVLAALAHQDVPFARLAAELGPARTITHNPLFQVLLVLQNTPALTTSLPGLRIGFEDEVMASAKLDLTLEIAKHETGYRARLEYNTALFDEPTVQRMAGHYQRLLQELRVSPHRSIATAQLLSAREQYQLLHAWNDTRIVHEGPATLHQLFEERAAGRPEAIAVDWGSGQISYGALDAHANRIGHFLRSRGITTEAVVGVHTGRTWQGVAAILGILKAGAAYLPLDPGYPADRRAFLITDARCAMVLCQGQERVPDTAPAAMLDLDADWPLLGRQPAGRLAGEVSAEHLAYVIYTSGSTGRPKGVGVCHRGAANLARAQIRAFSVTSDSRVLQFASWSFDASVSEMAMALCSGATLCLMSGDPTTLGIELMALLHDQAITHVTLPPSLLSAMPATELPALRSLIVAGERCPAELVDNWSPGRQFFNAYGPTESSVCTTLTRCTPADGRVTIGRPIDNIRVYVLDRELNPVPAGVPGELYLCGAGLARGYLGRPALTADRFVPNPFATTPGERLYRTGDQVRYLAGGKIEFLDRIDYQVKIRGYRVELGEVEAVICEHRDVQETTVLDVPLQAGTTQLVAFVVAVPGRELDVHALAAFLSARLPAYMRPTRIISVAGMPLTASGKIDRQALRAQAQASQSMPREDLARPRTSIEERLAAIFCAVLGIAEIGIHDNFFDRGGDSIFSIQVAARARAEGLLVTPKLIFLHQTISELAPEVTLAADAPSESGVVSGPAPLTPIQHWFFADPSGNLHHFNQSLMLDVAPELGAETIAKALELLVQHHDALRARFVRSGAGWMQHYGAEPTRPILDVCDLPALPDGSVGEMLGEHRAAMEAAIRAVQSSLDIEHGSLLRGVLFRRPGSRRDQLFLTVHHLVVDGVSWRILAEDLATVCAQMQHGAPVGLPPKTWSFKRWAEYLASHAHAPASASELDYWAEVARAQSALPLLPGDHRHGANTHGSAATVIVALGEKHTEELLREATKAYHTTVAELLLVALACTIARWASQGAGTAQLLIELESHGRDGHGADIDITRTVGWFTMLYPVLLRVDTANLGITVKSIKEQVRRVPHGGRSYLPLRYLGAAEDIHALAEARGAAEIGFNYLGQLDNTGAREERLFGLSAQQESRFDIDPGRLRPHVWDVMVSIQHKQVILEWTYSQNLHRGETIAGLATSFRCQLEQLIEHCVEPAAGGFTPSDFPQAKLSQGILDRFLRSLGSEYTIDREPGRSP